jgi:hypothetical protein
VLTGFRGETTDAGKAVEVTAATADQRRRVPLDWLLIRAHTPDRADGSEDE